MRRLLGMLTLLIGLSSALTGVFVCEVAAQDTTAVRDIVIEGNQRIEKETVLSYIKLKVGETLDPDAVNDSLKALFSTGLFADVSIRREGSSIVVRVVENPIINRIAFEGNKKVKDEDLQNEVQLRPRTVYTRTKVQTDVTRILDVYRRSGRFAATVVPKVIQLDQNRVDLVFEIDEGKVTGINSISFVGNKKFTDGELRTVIQTKESAWYRFLSTSDAYDPDRLTFDRELVRRFYLENGYADFRVVSAIAELDPNREGFFITFTVEEGEEYQFGTVDIVSQFPDLNTEALRGYLKTKEGGTYNVAKVDSSEKQLSEEVEKLGYPFLDVQPVVDRDRETKKINLTYDIQEGARVFVERIDIVGNVRTIDKVIRREFLLAEGDAFSNSRLRRSVNRLRSLGFFGKVDVNNVPGSQEDRTIVQVEVEEKSTGELSLGAGYSTTDGALGDISLRERNLLGRGLDLRASFRLSQKGTEFDTSYTDPYFLDKEVAFGIDAFRTTRDNQDIGGYDMMAIGGGLRFGYQLTEILRESWRYTLRQDEISDIDPFASRFIKESEGEYITSSVGHTLTYDQRNNRLEPTEGYYFALTTDVAGLGGDVNYVRNVLNGAKYWTIRPRWVLALMGEGGYITGFNGEDVRLRDRFYLGGDNLRGFASSGVGPRDVSTDDPLGGKVYYTTTAELSLPIYGVPDELGLSGKIFADAGSLFESEDKSPFVRDSAALRASIGVGVGWLSPFGPIRVDVAQALLKQESDKTQTLHFKFGTRF